MTIRRQRGQDDQTVDRHGIFLSLLRDFRARTIDRRSFLAGLTTLLAAANLPLVQSVAAATAAGGKHDLSTEPWLTFAAVQNHLFPATADAPGARDINATAYLKRVLSESHTDPDNKVFIRNGAGWLNDIAMDNHGRTFIELNGTRRETVLRLIAGSPAGERWLSLILLYIFEALMSDPVYGGNPDGIGWKWLEHQPGFPLPPANKTYSRL